MASTPAFSDDSVWRKLRLLVKEIDVMHVRVGLLGSGASEPNGDLTNAEVGAIHEYGAPDVGIPERSWLRSTFRSRRAELVQMQAAACRGVLSGKVPPRRALGLIGAWAAGACRDQIIKYGSFLFQPLAASTIASKAARGLPNPTAPLVATGQMARAITYVVEGRGQS